VVVVAGSSVEPGASVVVVAAVVAAVVVGATVGAGCEARTDTSVSRSIMSSRSCTISARNCSISSSLVSSRPQPEAPSARTTTRAVIVEVTVCRRIW
jgi:hypothetical protein